MQVEIKKKNHTNLYCPNTRPTASKDEIVFYQLLMIPIASLKNTWKGLLFFLTCSSFLWDLQACTELVFAWRESEEFAATIV